MSISIKANNQHAYGDQGEYNDTGLCIDGVDMVRFRSLTGQDPTLPFIALLKDRKSGCTDSVGFTTIEEAADDLCSFKCHDRGTYLSTGDHFQNIQINRKH